MVWPVTMWWDADPFEDMRRIQREMNRLFRQAGEGGAFPAANLWANENEAVLTAELPGVDPAKVDLTVHEDHLTLKGEREQDQPTEGVTCHRAERLTGSFVRSFRLPFAVAADQVAASSRNGVLTVRLPRAESTKPKQITVQAA